MKKLLAICGVVLAAAGPAMGSTNGLALTPPMGWNSWYKFAWSINETLIRETADAMVTNGLLSAGYQYLNLDDGWAVLGAPRDSNGHLPVDPSKFPSGLTNLASYIHGRGLKFGLYLQSGTNSVCYEPVGFNHTNDALWCAGIGVDFLKFDLCDQTSMSRTNSYTWMQYALLTTGRPIVYSFVYPPFQGWFPMTCNMARSAADETKTWANVLSIADQNNTNAAYAGPGYWNDPDMIVIDAGDAMTTNEWRSQFGLWCIMAAPLLLDMDVRSITATDLSIVTAPEVIAVDQDALGIQGTKIVDDGNVAIWSKPLSGGYTAVALVNKTGSTTNLTVNWSTLGIGTAGGLVRDLWKRQTLGVFTGGVTINGVQSHDTAMLTVLGCSNTTNRLVGASLGGRFIKHQ